MPQRELEIIISRLLAEHLTQPMFIVDPQGNLLFYNDPAGVILGYRFDETGPMPVDEWSTIFQPMDHDSKPLQPDDLPLVKTIRTSNPAHSTFWIKGLDQTLRKIEVTAFPLIGQADRFVGAVAIFWETS